MEGRADSVGFAVTTAVARAEFVQVVDPESASPAPDDKEVEIGVAIKWQPMDHRVLTFPDGGVLPAARAMLERLQLASSPGVALAVGHVRHDCSSVYSFPLLHKEYGALVVEDINAFSRHRRPRAIDGLQVLYCGPLMGRE